MPAEISPPIRQYLNDRCIGDEAIDTFGLHEVTLYGKQWIAIPVKDDAGAVAFEKLRAAPGNDSAGKMVCHPSGKAAQLFGRGVLRVPELKHVVVCEGEFDCMVLLQAGIHAVTSTAGAGHFNEEWLETIPQGIEVTVCFDADEAGEKGALKLLALLAAKRPDLRLFRVTWAPALPQGYDITDWFIKARSVAVDQLSWMEQAAAVLIERRKPWEAPPAPIVERAAKQASFRAALEATGRDQKLSLPIGVPWFDALEPIIRGCVSRIGAPSNTGKSKFCYWIANKALDAGLRVAIVSTEITKGVVFSFLESERQERSIRDIFQNGLRFPAQRATLYDGNLFIFDQRFTHNATEELLEIIQHMDCDLIIADFAQMFRVKETDSLYERMAEYAQRISEAVQDRGTIGFVDTSQLSNEDHDRSRGKRKADIAGLKGAGELTANADIVLELLRDKENERDQQRAQSVADDLAGIMDRNSTAEIELALRKHRYAGSSVSIVLAADFRTGSFEKIRDGSLDEVDQPAKSQAAAGKKKARKGQQRVSRPNKPTEETML